MGVDEHLTHMIAAGCLEGCVGIAIGDHVDVSPRCEASLGLEQVFADLLIPLASRAASNSRSAMGPIKPPFPSLLSCVSTPTRESLRCSNQPWSES
jgi:hypothetical protein